MGSAAGISEQQLRDFSRYRDSDQFSPLEKLVIGYAEQMTRTPADVDSALFDSLRERLDEPQLVELTATIAWENFLSRFNRGFDVRAQGFSEGAYCLLPERPASGGDAG